MRVRPGRADVVARNTSLASSPRPRDDPAVERLLTADEVAELLQVRRSWVYAEARAGRIPHIRLGRYRRFDAKRVEAWIESRETVAALSWHSGSEFTRDA